MSKPMGVSCALVAGAVLATVFAASAQEAAVAPSAISLTGTPAAEPRTAVAPSSAAAPAQATPPAKEAPAEYAGNDRDLFIGHIGVGYFGISQLPVGTAPSIVNAPVVGVRYWATHLVGIDAGIGFGYNDTTVAGTVGSTSAWGLAFHGGLPLALADSKHFTFELVPIEVTLGFTGGSTPNGATTTSQKGLRVDIGARVGAELHFGFIGIPQLALEGSIGLFFEYESFGAGNAANSSETTFSTSVGSAPWAIFTDTISALYYF
jgi:hypothetical protein